LKDDGDDGECVGDDVGVSVVVSVGVSRAGVLSLGDLDDGRFVRGFFGMLVSGQVVEFGAAGVLWKGGLLIWRCVTHIGVFVGDSVGTSVGASVGDSVGVSGDWPRQVPRKKKETKKNEQVFICDKVFIHVIYKIIFPFGFQGFQLFLILVCFIG
jgi:hypothetical protein